MLDREGCKRVPIAAMLDTTGRRRLMAEMKERGLSQSALANQLNITQNSVSLWVRGLSRPEPHHRIALETLLSIPASDWFTDEEASLIASVRPFEPRAAPRAEEAR